VDVDGNEYVDFHNGFGHGRRPCPPKIVDAVSKRIAQGSISPSRCGVVEVARELSRRFRQPQWRFTNSVRSHARRVRIARAFTRAIG